MPTGGKKTSGIAKGSTGAKPKQPATSKPTKTDNTTQNNTSVGSDQDFVFTGPSVGSDQDFVFTGPSVGSDQDFVFTGPSKHSPASNPTKNDNTVQNNTSVGSDQDFLFTGQSPEQKEDEWLNKVQHLMKIKKQSSASKPTKNDNTAPNNTSVGSNQGFLFTEQSPEQKEDEWLNKFQHLMKIKKNKVEVSNKFSENLKRLYDALLKELCIRCGVKYESVFGTADDGHSEIEMTMNVTPRDNTKGKVLSDKCSESSAKHQELTEENNKLKDQLKIDQDNLKKFEKQAGDYKKEVDAKRVEINQLKQDISEMKKRISETEKQQKLTKPPEKTGVDTLNLQIKKFEKQADDYKKEVDAKTAENNQLKQNISEMKKRISEIENQQKLTKPSEKTDDALHMLKDDTLNLQKKLSSQQQDLQQMQQKIYALTKEKANEKADFLKQKENPEKGLSKEAGMKLTESYPAIADLGDPNRPTRLAEKFEELFNNGWTDAMEELANARDEKSNINILKNMVEKSYEFGKTRATNYVKGLEKALLDVSNGIEITDTISKYIKDQRKNTSLLVLDGLHKSFVSAHTEYNVGGDGVKNFIKKAVSLCWLMAIQDPPMVLTTKLTGKFDTDRFRHYKKSGSRVDYVVWPVLFLHEGGPIMCKGVAQGK